MTREVAKQIISDIDKAYRNYTADEYKALDMAIQALSQEPTDEMVHVETLRQVMWERDIAIGQLKELGYSFGQKIEPCDDAVSRMALGRSKMCEDIDCYNCPFGVIREGQRICRISEYVKDLPSVTQKSGKWEFHCQHWSKCSICGYADKFADKWNYCPNCGAKMENVEKSLIDIKAESEDKTE